MRYGRYVVSPPCPAQQQLNAKLARPCVAIGDYEALAGINTEDLAERNALWDKFRHSARGQSVDATPAVIDYCAVVALRRVELGELSLITNAQQSRAFSSRGHTTTPTLSPKN